MAAVTGPLVLLWRRARANWRYLAVLFAGVLLATTLLASAPLYLGAIKELGLRYALEPKNRETRGVLDTAVNVPFRPLDLSSFEQARQKVNARVDQALGPLVTDRITHIRTPPLGLALPPSSSGSRGNVKAGLQSFSNYEQHSHALEGAFPKASPLSQGAETRIEAAVGRDSARAFRLALGDEITVTPGGADRSRTVRARIVGILEVNDFHEPYWTFPVNPFAPQVDSSTGMDIPVLPVLIAQDTFFQQLTAPFRGTLLSYWWYYPVDSGRIKARETGRLRKDLAEMESRLSAELPGSTVFTGLPATLDAFEHKLFFSRIPVLVMLVLVITVALYYVVMVANVVVDRHLAEIALLRSRGANGAQVMAVYLWEALIIVAAAFALGPLLGRGLVPLLGMLPAFSPSAGGSLLPVHMTGAAFLFSLLAAGLCFLALLLPALRGARFNLLSARAAAARPPSVAFFHRYYIDLFLLALAGILYWELTQRGALVTRRLFGADSTDYLLLITPAIFMLGTALALLRALPVLMRIASVLASATGRVWLVMGLWSLARNPVHYTRPVLLLSLVAGLAMFAASFNATVKQSFKDRGDYRAGADVRLVGLPPPLTASKTALIEPIEKQPGAKAAAAVYRADPRAGGGVIERGYPLLAVDPLKFQKVTWYRKDFSDRDLFALLRHLGRGATIMRGKELPEGVSSLGLWVKPAKAYANMSLWARVRDASGQPWRFRLGRLDFEDWRFLTTDLTSSFGVRPSGPLTLDAIYLWEFDFPVEPYPPDLLADGYVSTGQVNLSDLTAFAPGLSGGFQILEPFSSPDAWGLMSVSALTPETLKTGTERRRVGDASRITTELSWRSSPGNGYRGLFPSDFHEPLPVIAGGNFLGRTGRKVGESVEINVAGVTLPVRIADTVAFFPTMDPQQPFVLANLDTLLYYANLFRVGAPAVPNEVWVSLSQDKDQRRAFLSWLDGSAFAPYKMEALDVTLERLGADPLVGSGSRGIVFTTFLVLIVVAVGGYLGYFAVSSYRTPQEFAVLRALGLSGRQLAAFQLLVHGTVVVVALALGAWVGSRAHSITINFLQHTERGQQIVPPLAPHTDWSGMGVIFVTCLVVVALMLAWLVWSFARVPVWRVLRGGEQ